MDGEKRLFGTDGMRGVAGKWPITAEAFMSLGRALPERLALSGRATVVIGRDTRLSGSMLEAALTAGLCSMGARVMSVGVIPTPALALLTRSSHATVGAMISASHNPFFDNGIKLFGSDGFKVSDAVERSLEESLESTSPPLPAATDLEIGTVEPMTDAADHYLNYLQRCVEDPLDLSGLRVVVDCAHGATYRLAPELLQSYGATVVKIGTSPDGHNINHQVGATHPASLQREVLAIQADLGISFDGDGDRVMFVDHQGALCDGDTTLALATALLQELQLLPTRTVVATHMSNLGLERYLLDRGISLLRTAVGDRYVSEAMRKHGHALGGEQSGHIIFSSYSTTGDGLLTALQILRLMHRRNCSLADLSSGLKRYPQCLLNVHLKNRFDINAFPRTSKCIEDVRNRLGRTGRVLVRASGTEPVVRVMVEGPENELVVELAKQIAFEIRSEVRTEEPGSVS